MKQAREKCYRNLAEMLPQLVYEIDLEGNLTYSNRYGVDLTGYSYEEFKQGVNISQLFTKEEKEKIRNNLSKIAKGEKLSGNCYTLTKKDGAKLPVIIFSRPIIKDGRHAGFRGIIINEALKKTFAG